MIRSPRIMRPYTIVAKTYVGEIDGNANYKETYIQFVSVDTNYNIKQSQKGIQADGDIEIVIDMNDFVASNDYVEPSVFAESYDKTDVFTIRNNDIILFNDKEYTINSISEIGIPNTVFFQIIANE